MLGLPPRAVMYHMIDCIVLRCPRNNAQIDKYSYLFAILSPFQRNKRTFDFWQKVKKDIREIEIDRLQEKISLQHELLRVQDQQYQQHQEQRRQHEIKVSHYHKLSTCLCPDIPGLQFSNVRKLSNYSFLVKH